MVSGFKLDHVLMVDNCVERIYWLGEDFKGAKHNGMGWGKLWQLTRRLLYVHRQILNITNKRNGCILFKRENILVQSGGDFSVEIINLMAIYLPDDYRSLNAVLNKLHITLNRPVLYPTDCKLNYNDPDTKRRIKNKMQDERNFSGKFNWSRSGEFMNHLFYFTTGKCWKK